QVDLFHFNSTTSKEVYERYIKIEMFSVLSVIHSGVQDNRISRSVSCDRVRFGFIGSLESYKGFPFLKRSLENIKVEGNHSWELNIWGSDRYDNNFNSGNFHFYGKFSNSELGQVFSTMDILIVPSIWKET